MKTSTRWVRLLMVAAVCLLAMLLVPLVVGATGSYPMDEQLTQEEYYPWPEPVALGVNDVWLMAGGPTLCGQALASTGRR